MWLGSLIEWGMTHLTYWVVFILMVMENSVFPLPAELIVTPVAYNAANGLMSITWLVVITTLGSTVGAIINYYLSLYIGRPAIHRFADSRVGKFFMLSSKKMEYAEDLFRRKGNISIFIGRLLPRRPSVYFHTRGFGKDEYLGIYFLYNHRLRYLERLSDWRWSLSCLYNPNGGGKRSDNKVHISDKYHSLFRNRSHCRLSNRQEDISQDEIKQGYICYNAQMFK